MSIGELLTEMLEDLQESMNQDDEPELPTYGLDTAVAIMTEERDLEREAAESAHIERTEIRIRQAGCLGTLRFHRDSGHLHGLLWAEKEPGRWAAYPFAGQLESGDPHKLMARLRELGTPYHNPQEDGIPQFRKGGGDAATDDDGNSPD